MQKKPDLIIGISMLYGFLVILAAKVRGRKLPVGD